jgi:hypothetical protein
MDARRIPRLAIGSLLALSTLSCDLSTGPEQQPPIDLALDFCSHETPVFFAYQNFGGEWVRVTHDGDGTFRFTANFRTVVVYVLQSGSDYTTHIIGALNTELEQLSGATCLEENGTKQLNGTVAGIAGTQRALVSMMFASTYLQSPQTSFTLTNLPDRALDLVASRVNFAGTTSQSSDRIIVRKNVSQGTGTTMPVLDFASAEAVSPTMKTVGVAGVAGGEQAALYSNFFSGRGTSHLLFFSQVSASGDFSVPSIPTSLTADDDYHDMFLVANSSDGSSFRGVETYFRTSAEKTLTLGSAQTATPSFLTASTTPYLRHRVRMSMGSDYVAAINILLRQQFQQISVTEVSLTVTLFYFNIIGPWDFTFPDLSGVAGWQNAWGLQSGTPVNWTITTYSGRPSLVLGARAEENEAILFAGRSSSLPALRIVPELRDVRATIGLRRRLSWPRR